MAVIDNIDKDVVEEANMPDIQGVEERIKVTTTWLQIIETEVETLYELIRPCVWTTLEMAEVRLQCAH